MTPEGEESRAGKVRGTLLERLRARGLAPRKALGQHFLQDSRILGAIVRWAEVGPEDVLFEVGSGPGNLTEQLAASAQRVLAVEVDSRLAAFSREELAGHGNVEIVDADALGPSGDMNPVLAGRLRELRRFKWVSNLPYGIATHLIVAFLEADLPWEMAVVTLQEEVAERLTASPGTAAYGSVTVLVRFWAEARLVQHIAAGSFVPAPKVRSGVVRLLPRNERPSPAVYTALKDWTRCLFSGRRKQLGGILRRQVGPVASLEILTKLGLPERARPQDLDFGCFLALATSFPLRKS